jgi:hypothetical protein
MTKVDYQTERELRELGKKLSAAVGVTNLSYDAGTRVVSSDTGTDATLTVADGTNAGLMTSADFTKLAGFTPIFDTFASFKADTTMAYGTGVMPVATGDIIFIKAEGFSMRVAPSGASNHDVTTAGGVKTYAEATNGEAHAAQFNALPSNTAAQNDAAFVKAFAWLNAASNRVLNLGVGDFNISVPLPTITRADVMLAGESRETTEFSMDAAAAYMNILNIFSARVFVRDIGFNFSSTNYALTGYAITVDNSADTSLENIRLIGAAGFLNVGPTSKSNRLRVRNVRVSWVDDFQHRIVATPRCGGLVFDDVLMYGGGTVYRTVPTFDLSPVGLNDTFNFNKVTGWTRAGSKYGVYINADNGSTANMWFNECVFDKTGNGGAGFWVEMTGASTASATDRWKVQNIFWNDVRCDHGGEAGEADVGGQGGKTFYLEQGASTGYSYMRGFYWNGFLSTIRSESTFVTEHTGTDIVEDVHVANGLFRDASIEADGVVSSMKMGINKFSVIGCSFGYAEVPTVTQNIDYAIEVTNAAIVDFVIAGNLVYNATNGTLLEPTYSTLYSANRVYLGAPKVNGDDTLFTTINSDAYIAITVKPGHTFVDVSALTGAKSRTFDARGLPPGSTFTFISKTTGGFEGVIRDHAGVAIDNIKTGRSVTLRWTGTTLERDGVSFLYHRGMNEETIYSTDAALGYSIKDGNYLKLTGTITANRNINLSSTEAYQGATLFIKRTATGAFNHAIRDSASATTLVNLLQDQWCVVRFAGTAWELVSFGAYSVGSVSPGGATAQIQYNNAGAFAGDADFTWDAANNVLKLGGTDTGVILTGVTNEPSAPAAGDLRIYSRSVAGRMVPKIIGPSGIDTILQNALFQNCILMYVPSTGAIGTGSGAGLGPVWTSGGTVSHPTPDSTAPAISNQMRRTRYANVVTTTNQTLGIKAAAGDTLNYWRGNAAGLGGFFYAARFIVELYPASTVRLFAGLTASSATYVVASNTVLNNTCGLWHSTTDPSTGAGAFNFVTRNATTTTKQSITLANAIAGGNSYDFYMFCPPNGSTISWRLDDKNNGVTYSNSTSTTLPVSTVFMGPQCAMSNGTANIVVTTTAIGIAGVYTEADR